MEGRIEVLAPLTRKGFIRSESGRLVYFEAGSLAEAEFTSLALGQRVEFDLTWNEQGSEAVRVRLQRKKQASERRSR
jgi:cold shock CspA family protein